MGFIELIPEEVAAILRVVLQLRVLLLPRVLLLLQLLLVLLQHPPLNLATVVRWLLSFDFIITIGFSISPSNIFFINTFFRKYFAHRIPLLEDLCPIRSAAVLRIMEGC